MITREGEKGRRRKEIYDKKANSFTIGKKKQQLSMNV